MRGSSALIGLGLKGLGLTTQVQAAALAAPPPPPPTALAAQPPPPPPTGLAAQAPPPPPVQAAAEPIEYLTVRTANVAYQLSKFAKDFTEGKKSNTKVWKAYGDSDCHDVIKAAVKAGTPKAEAAKICLKNEFKAWTGSKIKPVGQMKRNVILMTQEDYNWEGIFTGKKGPTSSMYLNSLVEKGWATPAQLNDKKTGGAEQGTAGLGPNMKIEKKFSGEFSPWRAMQGTIFDLKGEKILNINVHGPHNGKAGKKNKSTSEMSKKIQEVVNLNVKPQDLKEISLVIISGDFNRAIKDKEVKIQLSPNTKAELRSATKGYKTYLGFTKKSGWKQGGKCPVKATSFGEYGPDNILVWYDHNKIKNFKINEVKAVYPEGPASDHLPLAVTFSWGPGNTGKDDEKSGGCKIWLILLIVGLSVLLLIAVVLTIVCCCRSSNESSGSESSSSHRNEKEELLAESGESKAGGDDGQVPSAPTLV